MNKNALDIFVRKRQIKPQFRELHIYTEVKEKFLKFIKKMR